MADPVVVLTNGVPTSGNGAITTLGQTLLDGANATHGITTGAAVTTDVAGTLQQYLRGLVKLFTSLTFTAGSMNTNVTNANTNGLATAAASAPVVIAPQTTEVIVVPTVTAGAYTAGNVLGGIMTFAAILPAVGVNGILESISIKFKATAVTGEIDVAVFKASPAGTYTDKTAPTWAAGDAALLLGIYALPTPQSTLGTMTCYNLDGIGKSFVGTTTSLFAVVTVKGTPTPASTADVSVSLSVLPG